VAVGIAIVGIVALATRLRPDLYPTELTLSPGRLSYPLTYWNSLALLVACGIVLCLHLTSDGREPWPIRILASALLPALAVVVYLTQSRGGMGAAGLGVALYVLLGRPRGLVLGLLAAAPVIYLTLRTAYDATALISTNPTGAAARAEGRDLAGVVVKYGLLAGGLRAAFIPLDGRLRAVSVPRPSVTVRRASLGGAFVLLVIAALAVGAPAKAKQEADGFLAGRQQTRASTDPRDRLKSLDSPARVEHWRVLLDASRDHRLRGDGAATFELAWNRDRPNPSQITEAHSLYIEALGELGIVGLALLTTALLAALVGIILSVRGRRPVAAAAGVVVLIWMVHASIDWDWELPAATVPAFLLAGTCAAHRGRGRRPTAVSVNRARLARLRVPAIVLGCVLIAIVPARTALSQARLDAAVAAYDNGDCPSATDRARASLSALGSRPDPSLLLGLCAARAGDRAAAAAAIDRAIGHDPGAWENQYALALVIGATGGDPRPALAEARRNSPLDPRLTQLTQLLRTEPRRRWPAVCRDFAPVITGFERQPIGG
jgi:O-antigen ligase